MIGKEYCASTPSRFRVIKLSDSIWRRLLEGGTRAVEELCARREPEGQTLEFKLKTRPQDSDLTREDKKNLGKSLSAFSNSTGGVLLWGIATGKRDDENVATTLAPIGDVASFGRRVASLIPEYLSPPHQDIETLPILDGNGDGFLAIRIGKSDQRPHMSMAPDDRRYYGRAGDQSQPLVDYQVRDLLRIRGVPQLSLGYQFERASISNSTKVRFVMTIINRSELTARHAYLIILQNRDLMIEKPYDNFLTGGQVDTKIRVIQADGSLVINPGIEVKAVNFYMEIDKRTNGERVRFSPDHSFELCMDRSFHAEVAVGCEDSPARWFQIKLDGTQLEDIATAVLNGREVVRGEAPTPLTTS